MQKLNNLTSNKYVLSDIKIRFYLFLMRYNLKNIKYLPKIVLVRLWYVTSTAKHDLRIRIKSSKVFEIITLIRWYIAHKNFSEAMEVSELLLQRVKVSGIIENQIKISTAKNTTFLFQH